MTSPKLPWYQFSLRSLLLLTLFVAVLCSVGVRTDWSVSAVIAVGGIAGGIVAGTWMGLVLGAVAGSVSAAIAAIVCSFSWVLVFRMPFLREPSWPYITTMYVAVIIGALIGGIVGGFTARYRSRR